MEEVKAEKFRKMLNTETIFSNLNLKADNKPISIRGLASSWITFSNCNFGSCDLEFLNFNQPELRVEFENCFFGGNIKIINCIVDQFTFLNTQALKSLNVEKGLTDNTKLEMNFFQFSNSPNLEIPELNTNFSFNNCNFKKFDFRSVKHTDGKFRFTNNTIGNKSDTVSHIIFEESQIFNAYFSSNKFEQFTSFHNSSFLHDAELLKFPNKGVKFYNSSFQKINFSNTHFNGKITFDKCDFESTTWFENCKSIENSYLEFMACKFSGYVLYDNTSINTLMIQHTTFEKKVSFYQLVVNSIKLHQLTFNKVAYFDEVEVKDVEDKLYLKKLSKFTIVEWKHTLRIIKQELQRTDNKIDYNRFRAYELSAYYRELKWYGNFKDKFILGLTWLATGFDHSWRRALLFTIIGGMLFYSLLYFVEFYIALNLNNEDNFTAGAFRFFLVTDFFSPFLDRKYLDNGYSWTVFVLGKIVIAFGIYEMIQAFRKFNS